MRASALCLGLSIVALTSGVSAQDNPPAEPFPMEGMPIPMEEMPTPFDLRVVAPELPIPRNGSILIVSPVDDFGGPIEPPIVQVSTTLGATTTTFAGSVRQVFGTYWAWTPAEPLELGQYLVSLGHPLFGTMSATITIVADAVLEPPTIASQPIASVTSYIAEQVVCQYWTGTELVDDTSFASRVAGQVNVSTNLTFSAEATVFHQYLYRAFMNASDDTLFVSSNTLALAGPYTEQADEYCYGVEAMDIATSTVHSYLDLTFCVAHGTLESLAEHEVELPYQALQRYGCMSPPSGYEELWCDTNADCIDVWRTPENAESDYCGRYFEICPDAVRPPVGTSGSGGAGGAGGGGGSGGGSGSGAGGASGAGFVDLTSDAGDDDGGGKGGDSGCSIVRAPSTSPLSMLLSAMLLALAGLRARRRRC